MTKIDVDKWIASMIENFPDYKERGRIPTMYEAALRDQGLEYRHGRFVSLCNKCVNKGGCVKCDNYDQLEMAESDSRLRRGNTYRCVMIPFYHKNFTFGKDYPCELDGCLVDDRNEDCLMGKADADCFEQIEAVSPVANVRERQTLSIWHNACDPDDLPALGRTVLAVTTEGHPTMASRPIVEEGGAYDAVLYGIGRWNKPFIRWWADIAMPPVGKTGKHAEWETILPTP